MKVKQYLERVRSDMSQSKASATSAQQSNAENPKMWWAMLKVLSDSAADPNSRLKALTVLRAGAFSLKEFAPLSPHFRQALGEIAEAPDSPKDLRQGVLDTLVNMKDETARSLLVKGLENPSKALVAPEAALELLSRDDHASVGRLARQALEQSNVKAVKQQAVRILGNDPSAKDFLKEILRNKNEFREIRRAGAVALRGLDPQEFESEAEAILADPEEFPEIKSTLEGALNRSRAAAARK